MASDKKTLALKQLQGNMWKGAYESGALKGEVYPDVVPNLKVWKEKGLQMYIYSSGSVKAQKLLFKYTEEGDLLPYFSDHFDLKNIGSKVEQKSYEKIAAHVNASAEKPFKPEAFLFLTDRHTEAVAAQQAGWNVIILVRPGNPELPKDNTFSTVTSFNNIKF
eukprot:TRINITY_DN8023_c0_g1_i2.p1 TRINITY_DN8023_c0_g1~~TRINITY_DN8023_c0_g1_i2.p1  ORF type:complete len:163 (+),score=32.49 TRINITY_DN8023_c0_g1_i2:385-873(+)